MGGVGVPVRGQQRLLRMLMGAAWTLECALGFSKKKKDAQGVELGTFQKRLYPAWTNYRISYAFNSDLGLVYFANFLI